MNTLSSSLLVKAQTFDIEDPLNTIDQKLASFESELSETTPSLKMTDTITSIIPLSDATLLFSTLNGEIFKADSVYLGEPQKLYTEAKGGKLMMTKDERILIYSGMVPQIVAYRDGSRFQLDGHEKPVSKSFFSPDEAYLLSVSPDCKAIIWDLSQDFQIVAKLEGHSAAVNCARLNKSSNLVVTCSADKTLKLWEFPSGQCLSTLVGHTSVINSCILTLDEELIASVANDNTVRLWNVKQMALEATMRGHQDNVNAVFNLSHNLLATLGDLTVRIWNLTTKSQEAALFGHTASPEHLVFTSTSLYSASADMTIRVWDIDSFQTTAIYKSHSKKISFLALSKDEKTLFSGSEDQTLKKWNIDDSNLVATLEKHTDFVLAVAISKDKTWVVTGGGDKRIIKWRADSLSYEGEINGHAGGVSRLAFVKNDTVLISASFDKSIKLWDFSTGTCLASKTGHTAVIYYLDVAVTEAFMVSGSFDSTLRIYDLENTDNTGEALQYLTDYPAPVGNKTGRGMILACAITNDCTKVLSVGRDRCIRFWDVATKKEEFAIDRKEFYEICVAISNDDSIFVTGSQNFSITLWNFSQKYIIGVLEGHRDKIDALKFSKNDTHLISGSSDTTLMVWNIAEMNCEAKFESHTDRVRNLAISDDDVMIVSVSTDQSVKIWRYFNQAPSEGKINFQGVHDQWKGLYSLSKRKTLPEDWMKKIYIQPYRINRLHIYCQFNEFDDLEKALAKEFPIITTSTSQNPLSIALSQNSANCVDSLLEYLCLVANTRRITFQNIVIQINPYLPELIRYSSSKLDSFLNVLMLDVEEELPSLGVPLDRLPKIIASPSYTVTAEKFINVSSTEGGKLPIVFSRSCLSWNLILGSSKSIELLDAISECSNLEIFTTKFIKNLADYKWNTIWNFIFIQTLLYWSSLVFFALAIFDNSNRVYYATLLLILNIVLGVYEILDMVTKLPTYFYSTYNWIDITVFVGIIVWSVLIIEGTLNPIDLEWHLYTWALAIANSIRGLTYFRTFSMTRFYTKMIFKAVSDSYAFLLILMYSSICFGIISYAAEPKESSDIYDIFVSLFTSYLVDLGDYANTSDLAAGNPLKYITFTIQSCINIIIIFNLLISILGSSYNSFTNISEIYNYKEMIDIIHEVESIMVWRRNDLDDSYIQCCEKFKTEDGQNDLIYKATQESEERILKQNGIMLKKLEDSVMIEFRRIRADIGNVISNQNKHRG